MAYEALARDHGRRGAFVAAVARPTPPPRGVPAAPVLVFDAETLKALGYPDAGYLLDGGVAAWLERARRAGACAAPRDWGAAFLGVEVEAVVAGGGGKPLRAGGLPAEADWARLASLDSDAFFLEARPIGGGDEAGAAAADARHGYAGALTPLSQHRWRAAAAGAPGVAASLCVYDDARFVEALLAELAPRVTAVVVSHATRPWYGPPRPAGRRAAARVLAGIAAADEKVSLVSGPWASEEAQRNSALALIAALPQRIAHVLLVDGDEFWHPVELDRALALVAAREAGERAGPEKGGLVPSARALRGRTFLRKHLDVET